MREMCFPILAAVMLVVNIFTLVVCFDTILKSKRRTTIVFTICALLIFAAQTLIINLSYLSKPLFYACVLSFLLPVYFIAKGSLAGKIFIFFTQTYIMNVIFILAGFFTEIFVIYDSDAYYVIFMISVLFLDILFVIFVLLRGKRVCDSIFAYTNNRIWFIYASLPVLSFFILKEFYFLPASVVPLPLTPSPYYILLPISMLLCFVLIVFAIINSHQKISARIEADFSRKIISTGQEHYQKINEMYEELSILRHDQKYHLKALSKIAESGNIEEMKKYLALAEAQIPENTLFYYCKNSVFNALLGSYDERCAKFDIKFDVSLNIPDELPISDYEMCIIMGNLLENAVEACQKLKSERKIKIAANTQGTHLAVMAENTFNGNVTEEGGQPVSTKNEGGFGLRSVRAVSERYNGNVLIEWDKEIFTVYVMLSL